MARNVNVNLEQVGFRNIGVKERPNLTVLKRTKIPAILIEAGFLNSDQDNERFDSKFEQISQAIADGIMETIGSGNEALQGIYRVHIGFTAISPSYPSATARFRAYCALEKLRYNPI